MSIDQPLLSRGPSLSQRHALCGSGSEATDVEGRVWPMDDVICWASTRAMTSVGPPAAKPTMRRIGLVGNACARAAALGIIALNAVAIVQKNLRIVSPGWLLTERCAPLSRLRPRGQAA